MKEFFTPVIAAAFLTGSVHLAYAESALTTQHKKELTVFGLRSMGMNAGLGDVVPDANAGLAKAFFGCASCGDPYIKTNVILSSVADGTQIVVQYWRMVSQYNGGDKRMEMEQNADFNQWQQILWNLRDQYK